MEKSDFKSRLRINFTKSAKVSSMISALASNDGWSERHTREETENIVQALLSLEEKTLKAVDAVLTQYNCLDEVRLNSRLDLVEDLNVPF